MSRAAWNAVYLASWTLCLCAWAGLSVLPLLGGIPDRGILYPIGTAGMVGILLCLTERKRRR